MTNRRSRAADYVDEVRLLERPDSDTIHIETSEKNILPLGKN